MVKGALLDFANFREPGFELHKITFHRSGCIHLTDRNGQRFRDGTKGPSFDEMTSPYELCLLAPPELHRLPAAGDGNGMIANLVLPDDISPFFVMLSLSQADVSKPAPTLLTLPLTGGRTLLIGAHPVGGGARATQADWPPFPFFLLRTAA